MILNFINDWTWTIFLGITNTVEFIIDEFRGYLKSLDKLR